MPIDPSSPFPVTFEGRAADRLAALERRLAALERSGAGPDLYVKKNIGQIPTNGSGTPDSLSVANPCAITVPVAGVYDCWFHASGQEDIGSATTADVYIVITKNGTVVTTSNEAWDRPTGAFAKWSLYNTARLTFAAGDVIETKGLLNGGSWGNYKWYSSDLRLRPVRAV